MDNENRKRLYLLKRTDIHTWDASGQFMSAVVVAYSKVQALAIHPLGYGSKEVITREVYNELTPDGRMDYAWCGVEDIEVEELGVVEDRNEYVGYDFVGTVHTHYVQPRLL